MHLYAPQVLSNSAQTCKVVADNLRLNSNFEAAWCHAVLCTLHISATSLQCSTVLVLLQINPAQTWLLHVHASLGHFLSSSATFLQAWLLLLEHLTSSSRQLLHTRTRSNVLNCSHCFPFAGLVFGVPALISSGSSTQQSQVRQDTQLTNMPNLCATHLT